MSRPFPSSRQLGTAIRKLRESRGITIEVLAEEADMDATYLSGIERRRRNPSWEKLRPIAEVLEVDISDLARRAEEIAEVERDASAADPSGTS